MLKSELLTDHREIAVEGAHLFRNFINNEQESALLRSLTDDLSNLRMRGQQLEAFYGKIYASKTQREYGVNDRTREGNYEVRRNRTPKELLNIHDYLNNRGLRVGQSNVNYYTAGKQLAPHLDDAGIRFRYHSWVATLSLASEAEITFRASPKREAAIEHRVMLPPRSLLILTPRSLYCLYHGIEANTGIKKKPVHESLKDFDPSQHVEGAFSGEIMRVSVNMRGVVRKTWETGLTTCPSEQRATAENFEANRIGLRDFQTPTMWEPYQG